MKTPLNIFEESSEKTENDVLEKFFWWSIGKMC